jgi:uncharacterized SAM-binding protein YcdF (DUF218 family)
MDDPDLHTALRNLALAPAGPMLLMLAGWLLARTTRVLQGFGRALVVLGFASLWLLSTPVVSAQLTLQRMTYGVRVARATRLPVLVTGGQGEGKAMAEFLARDFGLTPRWIETGALNTRENAAASAAMLREAGVTRIVLVTSALHMRRAAAEFESAGLQVVAAPVGLQGPMDVRWPDLLPGFSALRESHYVLYEALAEVVRRIRVSR